MMNNQARNLVILVDEQDTPLGTEDKITAHEKGALHRAFSVMLYRHHDNKLQFLLQQRAAVKYHCANLWTNTCCSHPQPGEGLSDSAKLRLGEELQDINLPEINLINIGHFTYKANFTNGLIEHEYDYVLVAEYNKTPEFFNTDEVQKIAWLDDETIAEDLVNNPQLFTPWFQQVYNICKDYIKINE